MNEFIAQERLILFEVGTALAEGRGIKNAVEGWWKIDPNKATTYELVLGKKSGEIVCAFRPRQGTWRQRSDGKWGFDSDYARDVWFEYVGKKVPAEYRNRSEFQYVEPRA